MAIRQLLKAKWQDYCTHPHRQMEDSANLITANIQELWVDLTPPDTELHTGKQGGGIHHQHLTGQLLSILFCHCIAGIFSFPFLLFYILQFSSVIPPSLRALS